MIHSTCKTFSDETSPGLSPPGKKKVLGLIERPPKRNVLTRIIPVWNVILQETSLPETSFHKKHPCLNRPLTRNIPAWSRPLTRKIPALNFLSQEISLPETSFHKKHPCLKRPFTRNIPAWNVLSQKSSQREKSLHNEVPSNGKYMWLIL